MFRIVYILTPLLTQVHTFDTLTTNEAKHYLSLAIQLRALTSTSEKRNEEFVETTHKIQMINKKNQRLRQRALSCFRVASSTETTSSLRNHYLLTHRNLLNPADAETTSTIYAAIRLTRDTTGLRLGDVPKLYICCTVLIHHSCYVLASVAE